MVKPGEAVHEVHVPVVHCAMTYGSKWRRIQFNPVKFKKGQCHDGFALNSDITQVIEKKHNSQLMDHKEQHIPSHNLNSL